MTHYIVKTVCKANVCISKLYEDYLYSLSNTVLSDI